MSVLPIGTVYVYGPYDSGKTAFATQCGAQPEEIVFFDSDSKGRQQLAPLVKLGMVYHDLTVLREGKTELAFFDAVMKLLDAIDGKKTKVVIFDPFTELSRIFKPHVEKNRGRYRASWSPRGDIAGAQEWQEAGALERRIIHGLYPRGVELVILTSHMRQDRMETAGGKSILTGRIYPELDKYVIAMANLRLGLKRPPSSPVPYALVTKNLKIPYPTPDGILDKMVLPPKLTCLPGERSLWHAIRRYWNDPVDFRELLPHERPTAEDIDDFTGGTGKFDADLLKLLLADAPLAAPEIDPTAELILNYVLAGNTPAEAATHFGVPLPVALKAIEGKT